MKVRNEYNCYENNVSDSAGRKGLSFQKINSESHLSIPLYSPFKSRKPPIFNFNSKQKKSLAPPSVGSTMIKQTEAQL